MAPMARAHGAGQPRRHSSSALAVAVLVLAAVQGRAAEQVLVEGDMLVERDGREGEALGTSPLVRRSQLFTQGRVLYFIDTVLTETPLRGPLLTNDTRIAEAIVEWESKTCIRFTMCTEEATCTKAYMRFSSGPLCASGVGAHSNGVTKVTLSGCGRGSTIHEIGHALGLLHEQSRKDRDEHVVVDYAHIKPDAGINMAKMAGTGRDIGAYDYGSIMHYPARAFSSDGKDTIIAPVHIGQRRALSAGDAASINFMYAGCAARLAQPMCMGSVWTNVTHVIPHSRSWDMDFNAVYSEPETMSVSYGAMTAPAGRVTTSVAAGASIGGMGFTTLRFTPTVADAGKTYVLSATFTGSDGAATTCSVSVQVARAEAACFGFGADDARVCSGHGVCVGGLQKPCVCHLGYGGVDCSAHAGCAANQVDDFDGGDVGGWTAGNGAVDTSFFAEGGGSMRVGAPGTGRRASATSQLAEAIAPTKVTFYMAGLSGYQTMTLYSGRTECTSVRRNSEGVFQVEGKKLFDEGVLQARRFYFVEMRLDWAGRKVSVLLDGKLVAEGVKMRKQCSDGMDRTAFGGTGGWVDEFQAWCTHFVSMAGPLADGVTAPELRGATESHHQQQALVLTVAGATDTWVDTRANKRRVIEALVADLPSPQGWNAHREALLPLAQADTLVTIAGHVLTVGPLRAAPALSPTGDETVSVRLTGSMFSSGHLPDTAGAALRFQLAGACPQSKTWGFESSIDIPADLASQAAITTRTVHEGRGALQFTSAYGFGTFQVAGAVLQPASVSMTVRLADTRYGRMTVSLVAASGDYVSLQYGYLHRLGFRTTDVSAPSGYTYEYVAPVQADRFQVIGLAFDWQARTFSISLDGVAVVPSAPLPGRFSSVAKVQLYSSRVPAYLDSLSLQCADPLPLFAVEGCGAAASMAVHAGTDAHGLGAQDRVAVVPAAAGGCAAAEEQCAALSACSWDSGVLSHELGRVHWAMGSQTRLQAGEQYRVCYFRKSAGRYDMLGGTFTGCGAGTPAPAPSTTAPATQTPKTGAPPTDAPATPAPATPAPLTPAPETGAPATSSPATPAPKTDAPATPAPATPAPHTRAPSTDAPATPAPLTSAPETDAPATPAPATLAPRTQAPSTDAPATASPATPAPATPSPPTPAPLTPAPETDAPATPSPATAAPKTDAPATPAPRTATPRTGAPPACSGKGCRRPNIVAFVPHQLGFSWDEAPRAGAVTAVPPMPHMDRVRAEGAVFQRAYSSSGDSVPSRFSFLTGRHASRSWRLRRMSARKVSQWNGRVRVTGGVRMTGVDAADNLQTALARSGYETIHSGEWGLHGAKRTVRNNNTALQQMIRDTGFTQVASACLPLRNKGEAWSHNPEWLVNTSLAAVGAAVSAGKPFFLHLAPTGPGLPAPTKAALENFDVRATPAGMLAAAPETTMRPRAELWAAAVAATEASGLSARHAETFAGNMWVDDALGAVLGGLEALGVLDETLVLVSSDVGATQHDLYEGRTRVMQAARFPAEVAAGTQVASVVTHTDTTATLLDLAGARAAATGGLDGASWRAEAAGAGAPPTTVPKVMESELERAVVMGRWKYVDHGATSTAEPELFDLATDPAAKTNVAGLVQHADTVAVMASYLACHDADTGLGAGAQGCAAPLIANAFARSP